MEWNYTTISEPITIKVKNVVGTPVQVEQTVQQLLDANEGWALNGKCYVLHNYQGGDVLVQPMVQHSMNQTGA